MAELDPVRSFALTKALETRSLSDTIESVIETAGKFEMYLTSGVTTTVLGG